MFIDHLKIKDNAELLERLPLFINDQSRAWRQVKANMEAQNKRKVLYLETAQLFLLLAVLMTACATLVKIVLLKEN
jgi:hypothetical protein